MLYDLASGPPAPGSLLESAFLLISLRRRESELFQTEALITAILSAGSDKMEPVENALKNYKNAMFPFLEAEKTKRADMAKEALKQWTSHKAFRVKPLWQVGGTQGKRVQSQLRRSVERTKQAEELRAKKRHTRL